MATVENPKRVTESRFTRLLNALKMNHRDAKCLLVSLVCHSMIFLLILFFTSPPEGRPDAHLIGIGRAPEEPGEKEKLDTEKPARPEEEEVSPPIEESSKEALQKLKDSFKLEDDKEAQEYLQERKQKILEKKKNLEAFLGHHKKIGEAIKERSKYGTLQPRTFYGVHLLASRIVFVLDVSGSMDIQEASIQLRNAYHALTSSEYFNIIAYSDFIYLWQNKLVAATEENKKNADMWLREVRGGGATNMFGALQKAFDIASSKAKVEVIYFLSDGLPTAGPVQNPLQILSSVRSWNKSKKIVIHTIGIGPHQDKHLMSTLAEQNYGRYYVR
jgi:hypothetical protein